MATSLVYTVAPYVPFTKILSANANQDKTDIKNRINWAGGTSTTTGLGDDNLQSNTVSGGGLTRATKTKLGTANYVVVNNGSGQMSETASISLAQGGTGSPLTLTNPGDTLQVNSTSTALILDVPPVPPALRYFSYITYD